VFARVSYRRVWTASGVAEDKVGAHIDARISERVRVFGEAVYSIPLQSLLLASFSGEWRNRYGLALAIDGSRYRPMFDLSSIWPSFWTDATDELRARTTIPLSQHLELSAAATGRRYALSESGPGANGVSLPDEYNVGGSAGLVLRMPAYRAALQGHAEGGSVGARGGVDADGWWWVIPSWVRVNGRLSLWEVDDELRPQRSGLTAGAVVGATVQLGRLADLHADIEDDINRFVGNRLRALAVLTIRGVL
jgi:hypothetical protein